jgi:phage baseplate assembly protein gpV
LLAKPYKWITEKQNRKSVSYKGTVVDNNDPLKIGRVRVRVFEMYGNPAIEQYIPDEDLPWINQRPNSFLGGTSSFAVPELNAELIIEYPSSDPHFGYYKGGINSIANRNTFFDISYPNSYGFIDSENNYVRIDKTLHTIQVGHSSGTTVTINADGSVTVISNTINITAPLLNMLGNVNIVGDVNIDGNTVMSGTSTASDHLSSGKSGKSHTHTGVHGGTSPPN